MVPVYIKPMSAVRRDAHGKPLLDKDGNEIPLIDPSVQQEIRRVQDKVLIGYVCFNDHNTHVSLILPPSQCPAGFRNHVEEYVKSQYPGKPAVETSQVPEWPDEDTVDEDYDDE